MVKLSTCSEAFVPVLLTASVNNSDSSQVPSLSLLDELANVGLDLSSVSTGELPSRASDFLADLDALLVVEENPQQNSQRPAVSQSSPVLSPEPRLRAAPQGTHTVKESASHLVCVVCLRSISVTSAVLVHQHEPLHVRCPGSCQPPTRRLSVSAPLSHSEPTRQYPPTGDSITLHTCTSSSQFKLADKILKRIPHDSRPLAADKLTTILRDISTKSTCIEAWERLLKSFHPVVFGLLRGGDTVEAWRLR